MKTILLTGGSGFIGKNILESDLVSKYDISAPRHQELDLSNTESVDSFFKNKEFDVVLHCATKPGHRNAVDTTNLFYTNVRMFQNLERHKDKFQKLINTGSGAVYDVLTNITNASEAMLFQKMGTDDHSFCKYVVSKQIERLNGFIDLNIFGIFGKHEDYAIRFISNAICKTLFDLPITLRQNRRFSYLDVSDLPPVLEHFIENNVSYHSYNVTPDTSVELLELAKIVQEISGKNIEIKVSKEGFGLDYYGNNQRIKEEIPDLTFTPIKQSIEQLFMHYESLKDELDFSILLEDK